MSTIYLAIIDCDDEHTYAAFSEEDNAVEYLKSYMRDNLEFYTSDHPRVLDYRDWDDITDFSEQLRVVKAELDLED